MDAMFLSQSFSTLSLRRRITPHTCLSVAQLDGTSAETCPSNQNPRQQATSSIVMTRNHQTQTLLTSNPSKSQRDSVVFSFLGPFILSYWSIFGSFVFSASGNDCSGLGSHSCPIANRSDKSRCTCRSENNNNPYTISSPTLSHLE